MSLPFTLPPLGLPSDIVSKQQGIALGSGIDAGFFNSILSISNGSGLFTNPFASHIAGLQSVVGQLNSIEGVANSVGAGATLSTITGHVTDTISMFSNMATNIVPTALPMNSVLAGGVQSACASLPGISAGDAPCVGPFAVSQGLPQLGTTLNLSFSQYKLQEQCGTINWSNPIPLLSSFTSMLSSMTSGAEAFLSNAVSTATGLLSTGVHELAGALSSGLSSVESSLVSSFAGPLASFAGSTFSTVKDQMAVGLAGTLRHMIQTNYPMKFMTTGLGSATAGIGSIGSGVTGAITSAESAVQGSVNSAIGGAIAPAQAAVAAATSSISAAAGQVTGTVGGSASAAISNAVSSAQSTLSGTINSATGSVSGAISSAENAVSGSVGSVLGGLNLSGTFSGLLGGGVTSAILEHPGVASLGKIIA